MKEYEALDKLESLEHVEICEPMDYLEFMALVKYSDGVITDSGGIQEETTFLGVPCLTFRKNTERPITLHPTGTNRLLEEVPTEDLDSCFVEKGKREIPLWDGKAAERIAKILKEGLENA